MKQNVRLEVSNKLTAIATLIKECAVKVYGIDMTLMQETALAALTHEGLCDMLERDGYTEKNILLINDFGKAVAQLYSNIVNPNTSSNNIDAIVNSYQRSAKNSKDLPN